jgi:hypothetical protein
VVRELLRRQPLDDRIALRVGENTGLVLAGFTLETITVWLWVVKRKVTQFPMAVLRDINLFNRAAGRDTRASFAKGLA